MSAHPIPAEKVEAIRKAKWAGASLFEISCDFDIDKSTAARYTADIPVKAKPGRQPSPDRERVAKLLRQGLSVTLICERLGVSRAHVFRVCKLNFGCSPSELAPKRARGVTIRNKLNARAVDQIKRDWSAGASVYDLAAEYDVSHTAILYHVEGLQRAVTPRMGRARTFDHERAVRLRQEGFKVALIAQRFGVSKARISQITRERKAAA